jgi:hypothetical protein
LYIYIKTHTQNWEKNEKLLCCNIWLRWDKYYYIHTLHSMRDLFWLNKRININDDDDNDDEPCNENSAKILRAVKEKYLKSAFVAHTHAWYVDDECWNSFLRQKVNKIIFESLIIIKNA